MFQFQLFIIKSITILFILVHIYAKFNIFNPFQNADSSVGVEEEGDYDLNDSGNWGTRFFRTMRDPEKQRKKDERRKQKEEVRNLFNSNGM